MKARRIVPVRVQDLPERAPYGMCLQCPNCRDRFSASRNDYFMAAPATVFRCQHDGTRLQLVTVREVVTAVS